jgi:hypothetical protein
MNPPTYDEAMMKWLLISHDVERDHATENCPLCEYYKKDEFTDEEEMSFQCETNDNELCPIKQQNNRIEEFECGCDRTPYVEYLIHLYVDHGITSFVMNKLVQCPECIKLALHEAFFIHGCLIKSGVI